MQCMVKTIAGGLNQIQGTQSHDTIQKPGQTGVVVLENVVRTDQIVKTHSSITSSIDTSPPSVETYILNASFLI